MNKSLLSLAMLASLAATPALAASASGTMNVQAVVLAECSITNVTSPNFGVVESLQNNIDANAAITVSCTDNVPYSVEAGAGDNEVSGQRRMYGGADYLAYNLYSDPARTTLVTTSGQNTVFFEGTATPESPQIIPLFARIPSGQTLPVAGNYVDTVAITVSY